jgi:hypothetical protein
MAMIEIEESVLTRLEMQAQSAGLSITAYLKRLADQHPFIRPTITGDELDQLLDEEASCDSTYSGTYSRADIYVGHD